MAEEVTKSKLVCVVMSSLWFRRYATCASLSPSHKYTVVRKFRRRVDIVFRRYLYRLKLRNAVLILRATSVFDKFNIAIAWSHYSRSWKREEVGGIYQSQRNRDVSKFFSNQWPDCDSFRYFVSNTYSLFIIWKYLYTNVYSCNVPNYLLM